MDLRKQYDQLGAQYVEVQERSTDDEAPSPSKEFIRQALGNVEGKKLLDVGCGAGKDLLWYQELGANPYGIDPSKLMLSKAGKRVPRSDQVALGDAEHIPFSDTSFNVLTSRMALHYLASLDNAYSEMHRVLTSEGQLIFAARHPLADLLLQEPMTYGEREVLDVPLYDGALTMKIPSHTLSDYLSPRFFELFALEGFAEFRTARHEEYDIEVPRALGVQARKIG